MNASARNLIIETAAVLSGAWQRTVGGSLRRCGSVHLEFKPLHYQGANCAKLSSQLTQNWTFSASCTDRGPPIWYSGLRPPFWPRLPSEAPSICVDCPNRGELR